MSARRTRANYGQIDIEQLQQETDNGHVSQRRTWLFFSAAGTTSILDLLLSNKFLS